MMRKVNLSQRVSSWLREAIEHGKYSYGERIPSELELMKRFGVSRTTIRQAISELVMEGWLYRVQGRGTFVSKPRFRQSLSRLTSFTEDMRLLGLAAGARLIVSEIRKPDPLIAKQLRISTEDEVVYLERLRLANGEPVAINVSILPHRLVPGLEKLDMENASLYEVLEGTYGHILSHAEQTLEPTVARQHEANLLGVKLGAPLLLVEGVTFLANGTPIERLKILYRGDRYKFHLYAKR